MDGLSVVIGWGLFSGLASFLVWWWVWVLVGSAIGVLMCIGIETALTVAKD